MLPGSPTEILGRRRLRDVIALPLMLTGTHMQNPPLSWLMAPIDSAVADSAELIRRSKRLLAQTESLVAHLAPVEGRLDLPQDPTANVPPRKRA